MVAEPTHLEPPLKPHLESVEETANKAAAHAASIGDKVAAYEKAMVESGFMPAFVASLVMIILSEIGDKTFFIAAILAMRHPRMTVFLGAIAALAAMTVISAAMGYAAPALLPKVLTHWCGVALFAYFGQQLIRDGLAAEHCVSEELEETEEELVELTAGEGQDLEGGEVAAEKTKSKMEDIFGEIFVKTFLITFFAEWGDRSQIATIALAATKDPYGVTAGGVLGHSLCTAMAVIGGRLLATKISERTMLLLGGALFIVFAILDIWKGPE